MITAAAMEETITMMRLWRGKSLGVDSVFLGFSSFAASTCGDFSSSGAAQVAVFVVASLASERDVSEESAEDLFFLPKSASLSSVERLRRAALTSMLSC